MALAPSRRDATAGSALDGVLPRRKNRRHRWTGHPHRSIWRGAVDPRNGEQPPARGKRGQPPGVGRRARQRPHARGRGLSRRPRREPSPSIPRWSLGPGGHSLATFHAFVPRHSAYSALNPCAGSARAWRAPQATALETVEKAVALTRLLPAPRKESTGNFCRP